jgi:micrococcal nuclease
MIARRSLVLLACAAACGGEDPAPESPCGESSGTVARVLDGDTIELEDGRHIRYLLVDTPEIAHNASETAECFGDEARAFNVSFVDGQEISMSFDEECTDRYDRTLAYVSVDGTMVNELLLERGYATLLVIPPNEKLADEFAALEASAREAGAGLWGVCP